MRFLLVAVLAGLCAIAVATTTSQRDPSNYSVRQKEIWRLFKYINQPSYYPDHVEIANTYKFYENQGYYSKPEVCEEFYKYYKYGKLLERGEIFSVFYEEQLKQAIALFKLFYYANNWDTLYKTAVWARNNVNEGMFLYSFSVALIHRPDTYNIILPPIYEIYPYYFYSAEVIQEAQYYKQMYYGQNGGQYNGRTIYANYSGYYLNLPPEQSMSYYLEDVGINSFYYYYNLYYPFWMSGEEYGLKYDNRGEVFYYMYQQILARYYLERLSNGFGEIEYFNWQTPLRSGYYPSLTYPNGLQFPSRPNYANLYEYFYNYGQRYAYKYTKVQDFERRIRDAIDSGYVYTKSGQKVDLFTSEGINLLGNLIEGNPDSPYYQYYGGYQAFARRLLGYAYQPYNYRYAYPSALEHFETSLRDPVFYQLYKKLISYFYEYKSKLPYYSKNDLIFQGVRVRNVEFERLVTYFDYFYADLSNAVYVTPEEFVQDKFKVQVAQQRLNYKPFTYKIYVDSDRDVKAVVKVFLGPKYDEYGRYINLTDNWMNFVQFDHFTYKLKTGENVISRNSKEIYNYIHDRTSYYQLYQKVMGYYEKDQRFGFYDNQIWYGYPQRYMLPVGSYGGVTYQFYVMVYKYVPYKSQAQKTEVPYVGSGRQYVDGYPMGYPFDRPIYWEKIYYELPNAYFYEAKIYNRRVDAVSYEQGYSGYSGYSGYGGSSKVQYPGSGYNRYPEYYRSGSQYPRYSQYSQYSGYNRYPEYGQYSKTQYPEETKYSEYKY